MPSNNKKQKLKTKDDIKPKTSDNVPDIALGRVAIGSSTYYQPPHLHEVYMGIYNHIAFGNILNFEENNKHRACFEQPRAR